VPAIVPGLYPGLPAKRITMMRQLLTSVFLLFIFSLAGSTQAQTPAGNYVAGFRQEGNPVFCSTTNAEVKLECCTPEMFRVRTSWI
jgi:alpha-glucosidase